MNTHERAAWGNRLRANEDFQTLIKEFHAEAIASFVNSGAADAATREEAHAMLRAEQKLEGMISSAISGPAFEQKKKGQHRGSD